MKRFINSFIKNKKTLIIIAMSLLLISIIGVLLLPKEQMTSAIEKNTEEQEVQANTKEVQDFIVYQDKLIAEEFLVGWTPIEMSEIINTADREVHFPNITSVKKSYTEEDIIEENGEISFKEDTNNVKVRPEERIFYEITVKNLGEVDLENVEVSDMIPEQTKLLNTREEAVVENNKITWRVDIPSKSEIKLVFSVQVDKEAEGIIRNVAIVNGEETNEVENPVIKPRIVAKKDSNPVTNSKVEYDQIITYTITVENEGDDSKDVVITDDIPENTVFYSVQNGGEEIKDDSGKTTGVKWNKNIPAKEGKVNGKVEVTFKVQVKGNVTDKIENVAKVDDVPTNKVEHTIEKQVEVIANNYTGKNIVIVLDLSSSMLQVKKSDITADQAELLSEYNAAADNDYIYPKNASNSVELSQSKLAKAKTAIKQFAAEALKDERNTITLITFNYSDSTAANKGINQYTSYKNDRAAHPEINNYVGTQVLLTQETSISTINSTIDGIKLRTRYLLTNIVSALEKTNTVIEETLIKDKRDIEVVFIGDGKPSFNTENCANQNNGFYSITDTMSKIQSEAGKIKAVPKQNNLDSNLYALEYDVPSREKDYANQAFTKMTGQSSNVNNEYRYSANSDNILNKLKQIAKNIEEPPIKTYPKTDELGIATQSIPENTELVVGVKPITLTVSGETPIEFKSLTEIQNYFKDTGRIKFENGKFTFDVTKFPAESSISLEYYYTK